MDSAACRFYITLNKAPYLDGNYTVFGKVTSGMDCVDKIKKGSRTQNGKVDSPDKIVKMTLAK